MRKFITNDTNETYLVAKEFALSLENGDIVLLHGDLGAGKTMFVKGVIKALGGDEDLVTSPTFTIVNEYEVNDKTVYHFDLYRLENPDELYNIGYEEYFYSDKICFVEWSERASEFFDKTVKHVYINKLSSTKREIIF